MKHEMGWARVRGVVKRRRWPVVFTTLFAMGAGILIVKKLPPSYQARTVVRINDPRPAREYVSPIVSEPDGERLKSARLGFLAQPVVAAAADKVGLLPAEGAPRAKALSAVTERLDARQEGEDTFIVTFEDRDPARAREFLAALIEAHGTRRSAELSERAARTAAYLLSQVESLRPRVADAEATVEKYRLSHYGALPDQLEGNLRILDENEMTMHAIINSLDAAEARRRDVLADAQSPLRQQEEQVARELSAARTRFAPDAPEVKALEAELTRVREERHSDESAAVRRIRGSSELRMVDEQIGRLKAQIAEHRQRGVELRKRVEASAKNGEAIVRMSLERDVLRDRFKSLVTKHEEAQLAAGLEAGVSGPARTSVLEPAWASATPVKPSKPLLALIALTAAILLGLGVGFIIDTLDRRVLAADDVRALTGDLPILAVVPHLARRGRVANSNDQHAARAAGSEL
jgi:succinoglycan biosynthesis transport protein ExoP